MLYVELRAQPAKTPRPKPKPHPALEPNSPHPQKIFQLSQILTVLNHRGKTPNYMKAELFFYYTTPLMKEKLWHTARTEFQKYKTEIKFSTEPLRERQRMKKIQLAVACVVLMCTSNLNAGLLVEFDLTDATSDSDSYINAIDTAPGIATSPLVPLNISGGGINLAGAYWSFSWTAGSSPYWWHHRLFFNLRALPNTSVEFDSLDFAVFAGQNSDDMGIELRVFGSSSGTTLASPLLHLATEVNTPSGYATPVSLDVSALPEISYGEGYQFSLSFYSREALSRIGLSGESAGGQNVVLTGQTTVTSEPTVTPDVEATPEPTSLAIFGIGALCMGAGAARRRRKEQQAGV